ncbi:hypothetical protein GCM10009662_52630 [Catellatospora coxensis]|uniref:Uncharacterized protein n=1 Tax=Catellatospora coxensis TaxID=310354 RepID=A0A8J3PBS9_9ACTN|nr:hypothetical protein Cco03nite_79220 [Catellatospora coxensis]
MHGVLHPIAAARQMVRQPAVHQLLVRLPAGTPDVAVKDLGGGGGDLHLARVPVSPTR